MGIAGRTARLFLESRLTPLLAATLLLLGLFAVAITPREEEPQINVTMANVFVPFPGASAREVESAVSTPAEQVLSRIAGIKHVYSVSKPGLAVLTVEYEVGQDNTQALVRLYDTVISHGDWFPRHLGVGQAVVRPIGIDDVPVVAVTLWTDDIERGAYELERVAHAAESELKQIRGTRDVTTIGGPGNQLRVLLDAERLNAYGLTPQDIAQALQAVNATQAAGDLVRGNREIAVQAGEFMQTAGDVNKLMLAVRDGKPVYVADVASVVEGPGQPERYVWIGKGPAVGKKGAAAAYPAVTIAISKKPGTSAVEVAERVIARMQSLQGSLLPQGVHFTVTRNYGETADAKAQKLIGKLVFATAAVVVLVLAALGRREAIVVGAAVALTLAATLFASWAWGFTLNRVSLFALIFSIGILVDDAIVVVENIHRRRELEPQRPFAEVIPAAVDEVGGPTILATFTVIAALLPMAFVTGLMGPYMSPIPINASMGMLISLVIAFSVTPWLSRKLLKRHDAAPSSEQSWTRRGTRAAEGALERLLLPLLGGERGAGKRRRLGIAIAGMIAVSLSLAAVKLVVLKMLPFDDKSEFQLVVDMPTGTPLEQTARVLHEMGDYLATVPEVRDYEAYAGTAAPINFNGLVRQYYLRSGPEVGDIQVNLADKHHRSLKSHEIAAKVRPALEKIAARYRADFKLVEVPPGPPVLAPIVAEVYGPDYAGQMRVAKRVRQGFAQTAGIVAIDDSVDDDADKVVLRVLQAKAAQMGVAQRDIVATIRMGLGGEDVTALHDTAQKYALPIRLMLPPETQGGFDALLKLKVRAADGTPVPLSELVEPVATQRDKAIYHKDLLPVAYVVGDMAGKLDSPLYGMFGIRSRINDMALPEGGNLGERFITQPDDAYAGYALKWDGEWQITYETFRDMGLAYAVGLVMIYLLVVAAFGSYVTPLVIMAPIPLTIIGVLPGHALLGAQFTATSMIGMIALAGIIVRNSILLVDFIRQQTETGGTLDAAVVNAVKVRAKPIALTGLAAMIGALFILDDPIFNGLAISLIFGILVSTLLTLVVIPVLYYAFNYRQGLAKENVHDH